MSLSPESLYLEAARRSISSNSSSTAPRDSSSEFTIQVEEDDYKKYEFSITKHKPLPLLPSSNSHQFDPYLIEHSGSYTTFVMTCPLVCKSMLTPPVVISVSSLSAPNPRINHYIPACPCAGPGQYTPYNRNRHCAMCRNTYSKWSSHRTLSLATCGSFTPNESNPKVVGQSYR
jgi:hypothetical protein